MSLLLLLVLASPLISCHAFKGTGLSITPASATLGSPGSTIQFRALETATDAGHPSQTTDVTNQVTWVSSNPTAATISSKGLATSVGSGTTTITATTNGSFGVLTANATLTASGHDLLSLAIVPSSQTLFALGETAQFVAIGTFNSDPITQDMTDLVIWRSTDVNLATINTSGLATAVGCASTSCATTITASATSFSGNTITGVPAALTVMPGSGGSNLPSLTVYKVGLGTGTVSSSPAGTGINCGAACTANFVLNSTVTLVATPAAGSVFGGWSANCLPATSATCTVTMGNSETVGAVFNQQ
jgi:hypothetical protein